MLGAFEVDVQIITFKLGLNQTDEKFSSVSRGMKHPLMQFGFLMHI